MWRARLALLLLGHATQAACLLLHVRPPLQLGTTPKRDATNTNAPRSRSRKSSLLPPLPPVARRTFVASTTAITAAAARPGLVSAAEALPLPRPGFVRLYVCRHGETEFNRLGKAQGRRVDAPLNDNGRAQAAAVAQLLSGVPLATAYSSSLSRAKETRDIIVGANGRDGDGGRCPRVELSALDEVDFGPRLDGSGGGGGDGGGGNVRSYETEIARTYAKWMAGKLTSRVGGSSAGGGGGGGGALAEGSATDAGETGLDVLERCQTALRSISAAAGDYSTAGQVSSTHASTTLDPPRPLFAQPHTTPPPPPPAHPTAPTTAPLHLPLAFDTGRDSQQLPSLADRGAC